MKSIEGIKPQSQYQHKRLETLKTIAITVLLTGIVCFLFGMHVANQNNASKQDAVKTAVSQLK